MFDLGWSEMAVIMLVALVVIGPKDLPRLARSVGQWVAKGRAMARDFQRSLEEMAREAELDDVKREIEKVGRTNISKTIEKTIDPSGELGKAFNPNGSSKGASTAAGSTKAANGEVKPAIAKPEPTVAAKPAAEAEPKAPAEPKAAAKPRASGTAKPAAKPKTGAKPRTASTAKAAAKPKAAAGPKASAPKTARTAPQPTSETAEAETVADPH